jgi:hypothetical protein
MLRGRPLYDTTEDRSLFQFPAEWDRVVRALDRQLNVMVIGARGVGKTTLLRQVQATLRKRDERVVFVDATAVADTPELAARIQDALGVRPSPLQEGLMVTSDLVRGDATPPIAGASRPLQSAIERIAGVKASVVLVDASGSAEAVYGFFGRLRDALWQTDHTWLVAVDHHEQATALKPPADAFFDTVIALQPFSTQDLTGLLARRVSDVPGSVLGGVAAGAEGNPRAAIRALNEAIVHGRDPTDVLAARGRLLERAADLGRPHGMLMAELLDRGSASPSDDDLQKTLGISRARLTQLFRTLFEHGLVVAGRSAIEGPGRPRTLYRPRLEGDDS